MNEFPLQDTTNRCSSGEWIATESLADTSGSTAPSLNGVDIPDGHILDDWVDIFTNSVDGDEPNIKENLVSISAVKCRHRKPSCCTHRRMLCVNLAKVQVEQTQIVSNSRVPLEGHTTPVPSVSVDKGKGRQIELDSPLSDDIDDEEHLVQISQDALTARTLQQELNTLFTQSSISHAQDVRVRPSGIRLRTNDCPFCASVQLPPGSHLNRILTEEKNRDYHSQHPTTPPGPDSSGSSLSSSSS